MIAFLGFSRSNHRSSPKGTDVMEDFQLSRSHRRGATTRATSAGVSSTDIDWINQWNIGADQVASGPMRVLYSA